MTKFITVCQRWLNVFQKKSPKSWHDTKLIVAIKITKSSSPFLNSFHVTKDYVLDLADKTQECPKKWNSFDYIQVVGSASEKSWFLAGVDNTRNKKNAWEYRHLFGDFSEPRPTELFFAPVSCECARTSPLVTLCPPVVGLYVRTNWIELMSVVFVHPKFWLE